MGPTIFTVVAAIVTGVLALIGGFTGAALARRNEYEKWLRQERSTVFTTFLRQMYDAQAKAIDVIYSSDEAALVRDIKVSEIFFALTAQAGVVRLYLNPDDREAFSVLVREFAAVHSPTVDQMLRLKKSEATVVQIQTTFERTLDPHLGKTKQV